jgi:Tol biopolymer transport system component
MFARKVALVLVAGMALWAVRGRAEEQGGAPAEGLRILLKEEAVCDIDAGMMRGSLVASADLRHVAYVARPAGQKTCFVALDGAQGKAYDGVSMLTFSGDSKRLAYVAKSGERYFAVVDGAEGPQYDDIAQVVFSPDSKRVAYRARVRNEDNWAAVVDGAEGRHYSAVGRLVFSPDSARLAYSAWSQYGEEKGGTLVVDGVAEKIYDGLVSDAVFSPDSKRLAYGVKPTDGTWQAVVADGVEGKHYERLAAGVFGGALGAERLLLFSSDGTRLAYVAMTGGKWVVVVDGAEGKQYDEILAESLVFSPDSKRAAYFASEAGEGRGLRQYLAVVDGAEGGKCVRVFAKSLVFSADSKRVAYCVDQLGQTMMFGGGGGHGGD